MHLATTLAPATSAADLDQLGDEIATLSAHLDAATARLLALLREFDARGGWANGARSCAEWLSWRVGLDLGAARERVRVARALGGPAPARGGPGAGGAVLLEGARPHAGRHAGDGGAPLGGGAGGDGGPRGADRAGVAAGGPAGGGAGGDRAAPGPVAPGVPGRGWHDRGAGAAGAGGGGGAGAGAGGGAGGAVRAGPGHARGGGRRGSADAGPAASGCPRPGGGDSPRAGARSRRGERAVPGGRPRGRRRAGRPRPAGPVGARGRRARFRGNVEAPSVRCDPSGHAPRGRRPGARCRKTYENHPAGAAAGAPGTGLGMPLPGLRGAPRPGASSPPLGERRPDSAGQSRTSLSTPSRRRPRGGLPGRAGRRRDAPLPHAGRPADSRGAGAAGGAGRPDRGRWSRRIERAASRSTRGRGVRAGTASGSTSAGRSTSCTPRPTRSRPGKAALLRSPSPGGRLPTSTRLREPYSDGEIRREPFESPRGPLSGVPRHRIEPVERPCVGRHGRYPFNPLNRTPSTIRRFATRKTISSGSALRVAPAMIGP